MLNRRYDSERLSSSIRHDYVHTSHTVIVHWKPRHIMNAFPTHSSLALIISRYVVMLHTAFARFLPNQQSIPGSHLEYLPILLCPSYNCWYRTLVSSCILVTSMNWWYDSIVVIHRPIVNSRHTQVNRDHTNLTHCPLIVHPHEMSRVIRYFHRQLVA